MNLLECFVKNAPDVRGIRSFRDWRFYMVSLLLSGSTLCLMRDPYFIVDGEFVYRQGGMVLLLALVVYSAFAWETPIFGKPAGANLLQQTFALAPFALLIVRLCAADGGSSQELARIMPSDPVLKVLSEAMYALYDLIPSWLADLFRNWHVTLLFLLVMAALCLRRVVIRTAAIVLVLLVLFICQINRGGGMWWMLAGMALLIAALSFMFCRYDRISYYENVLARIRRGGEIGREELRTILTVMAQLEYGERLSNGRFRQIVKDCYSADRRYADGEIDLISGEVAKRMIMTHALVTLRNDTGGVFISPDPLLFFYGDNLLTAVATLPRIVFVAAFALLWVIMPFDFIPDAIPFVGVLDDIAVTGLSLVVAQHAALPLRRKDG